MNHGRLPNLSYLLSCVKDLLKSIWKRRQGLQAQQLVFLVFYLQSKARNGQHVKSVNSISVSFEDAAALNHDGVGVAGRGFERRGFLSRSTRRQPCTKCCRCPNVSLDVIGQSCHAVKTPHVCLLLIQHPEPWPYFPTYLVNRLTLSLSHTYIVRRLSTANIAVKHFYHGEKGV